jgi:hypothetical protein
MKGNIIYYQFCIFYLNYNSGYIYEIDTGLNSKI